MATRSERDRCKGLQEKHQAILSQLLKEEDNKYCVDCDAKGPRWGSWNLGVFLCIRCAGIHRNLGVHISKVKSVNLDTWTPEQLGMVQEMGNSRARAVYEANLPDHFRRPQTDSTLEAFIRAKYEQKKYIAKEWVPPQPKIQAEECVGVELAPAVVEEKKEKKKARPRPTTAASNIQLSGPRLNSKAATANATPTSTALTKAAPSAKKKDSNIDDLIGLDIGPCLPCATTGSTLQPSAAASRPTVLAPTDKGTPESSVAPPASTNNDIFSDFISASTEPAALKSSGEVAPAGSDGLEASLFGGSSTGSGEPPKSTKDSIMALFRSAPQQPSPQAQQNFGMPAGIYINQQGSQQQMPNMQIAGAIPGTMPGSMPVSMAGAMPNGMQNGMMAGGNMMGTNVGMMGVPVSNNMMAQGMQQTNPMSQNNLMVVDPMAQLRTNLVHNMVYPGFIQSPEPSQDGLPSAPALVVEEGLRDTPSPSTPNTSTLQISARPSESTTDTDTYMAGTASMSSMPGSSGHPSSMAAISQGVYTMTNQMWGVSPTSTPIHRHMVMSSGAMQQPQQHAQYGGLQYSHMMGIPVQNGMTGNMVSNIGINLTGNMTRNMGCDMFSNNMIGNITSNNMNYAMAGNYMGNIMAGNVGGALGMRPSVFGSEGAQIENIPMMTQAGPEMAYMMQYCQPMETPMGQMMMGPMGAMPAMQTGQMMPGQGMPGQMGQMAPPAYNVAATQGLFNMQPQQPTAAANQQFQQLANQMAGISMGAQAVGGFPTGGGIAAGGGGMWGAPQPGQTLSTNLWQ